MCQFDHCGIRSVVFNDEYTVIFTTINACQFKIDTWCSFPFILYPRLLADYSMLISMKKKPYQRCIFFLCMVHTLPCCIRRSQNGNFMSEPATGTMALYYPFYIQLIALNKCATIWSCCDVLWFASSDFSWNLLETHNRKSYKYISFELVTFKCQIKVT